MNKLKALKKNKLLIIVALIYLLLAVIMPSKAVQSGKNSMYYVIEMLEIMPVIFVLTSLIEAWVPKKVIMNGFGEKSGIKGGILSFILGSISAGPIYAAFPVCKMLLKKGASIFNIIIILSAWAVVKVPMLANETKFLGFNFMAKRWVLTTISIFLMAYIISLFVKKDSIPMEKSDTDDHKNEAVVINRDYCIGCGLCTKICPEHFNIIDGKAKFISKADESLNIEKIIEASEKCPAKIIEVKKS